MSVCTYVFLVLLACQVYGRVEFRKPTSLVEGSDYIENQYIFKFAANVSNSTIDSFLSELTNTSSKLLHRYSIFRGFAAIIAPDLMSSLLTRSDLFELVEQDTTFVLFDGDCQVQFDADWGLCRICRETPTLDNLYTFSSQAGEGVNVYIIDSGININHVDFGGRAVWGANLVQPSQDTDCNGHGTHVAGIVGSTTYGVAKKATLIAVKVSNCTKGGPISSAIKGVEWVTQDYVQKKIKSIVNMSLGATSGLLNDVVATAIASGLSFTVAAGNSRLDACTVSPAMVPGAITVAATTVEDEMSKMTDLRSRYSNFGPCISVFAPGELIESTWIGPTNTETMVLTGTSMASPVVAGVAALYLGANGAKTPAELREALQKGALSGIVDNNCADTFYPEICEKTPNLHIYVPCQ